MFMALRVCVHYHHIDHIIQFFQSSPMETSPPKPFLPSSHSLAMVSRLVILVAVCIEISLSFLDGKVLALDARSNVTLRSVPAVLVFGDSIVDPGNNNDLTTLIKCNFPPYGRDFVGGKPSGRFSNGKVPSDFLAELFGVKEYLPAYLDPNLEIDDLLTGVSFASGATGYDPLTPKIASVLSLSDQLDLFKEYIGKITAAVGEEKATNIVTEGLHVVVCGSDDLANTYFSTPFRRAHYDIPSYTDLMVESASSFFKELSGLGATKIAVLSLPPIGCVPSQRTLQGGLARECSEQENQAAQLFNSKISARIDDLNTQLSNCRIVFLDIYSPLLDIIQNPSKYGFEIGNRGCCGTGIVEVSILCTRLSDSKTCKDDSKYVFWDSYHPTERAYQILTTETYNKYKNLLP